MKGTLDLLVGLNLKMIMFLVVAAIVLAALFFLLPQLIQGLGPGFYGVTDTILIPG